LSFEWTMLDCPAQFSFCFTAFRARFGWARMLF